MTTTQYAVCHLQKGSGNDSGMACHIERKNAKGEVYIPENADKSRTYLNRELVRFHEGVHNRTEAIQYRLDNARLHRKVGKNQVQVVRIILTGTHEQMMKIAAEGKLDAWCAANMRWLRETYGADNVVSCVLHMDEKTPHLHASVVPIVETERVRREREGEKKNKTQGGPRLCCDEVMARWRLRNYQDTYAEAMKPFGLQRGLVGSTAEHKSRTDYQKQQEAKILEHIDRLLEDAEKAKEGKSWIFSLFGTGELADTKKKVESLEAEIADLKKRLKAIRDAKNQLDKNHKQEQATIRNGHQAEIDKLMQQVESIKQESAKKDDIIRQQKVAIAELDKQVHPERYSLSSGATLTHHFIPNYLTPNLHIWTKVGDEEYDVIKSADYKMCQKFANNEITLHELVNATFEPWEQVSEGQAKLLEAMFIASSGGPAQTHIGTGSGGSTSSMPWRDPKNEVDRRGVKSKR